MYVALPVCVLVLAIVVSFVTRIFAWGGRTTAERSARKTIFVGIVSYCDKQWYAQVEAILRSAAHPDRIRVGVVEFVKEADDSTQQLLPSIDRHRVRVHTVAHTLAKSQQEARRLCFRQCYRNEDIVLFARSCELAQAWDVEVDGICADKPTVLSTTLNASGDPTFPCLDVKADGAVSIVQRPLKVKGARPVASLVWQADWTASAAAAATIWLKDISELDVSARLVDAGWQICVPGRPLCARASHPRGVKAMTRRTATAEGRAYSRRIGVDLDRRRSEPAARLGLLYEEDAYDSIAKYGSIVGARIAHQSAAG